MPFNGETLSELCAKNLECKINYNEKDWSGISEESKDLVSKMLEEDPNLRISAKEALNHL